MTKVTYEVVILELRTMRVIDGFSPKFTEQEGASKWLRQSLKLVEGNEYRIRKTAVELVHENNLAKPEQAHDLILALSAFKKELGFV